MAANPKISNGEQKDRISRFTDSPLVHILSFLPTKYAARTSVLSKRWADLFLRAPKIVLEDSAVNPQSKQGRRINGNTSFIDFVNKRLALCEKSSVTEFRLKCMWLPEASVINLWLAVLRLCNVEVVEIEEVLKVHDSPPLVLTLTKFCSENLAVLKLRGGNFVLKIPYFLHDHFLNLKVLHLECLDIDVENYATWLECPQMCVLEDLRLEEIRVKGCGDCICICIVIPTLKKLAISGQNSGFRIQIFDHQNLQTLEDKALIEFTHEKGQLSELTTLKLLETRAETLWDLLGDAPNLERLVYEMGFCHVENLTFLENEDVPTCLGQSLREMRITKFEASEADFHVLSFFLQRGTKLEKVVIEYSSKMNAVRQLLVSKQLLKLERCSPKCKIEAI